MRAFACPITKEFFEYPEDSEFLVYVRRYNSTKRLIYVGKSVHKAWEMYQSIKLFKQDFRYLMFSLPGMGEQLIKKKGGKEMRPLSQQRPNRERPAIKYNGVALGPYREVPVTLSEEMKRFCKSNAVGQSKLYQMLLSDFFSKTYEEQKEIINKSEETLNFRRRQDASPEELERIDILAATKVKKSESITLEDDLL